MERVTMGVRQSPEYSSVSFLLLMLIQPSEKETETTNQLTGTKDMINKGLGLEVLPFVVEWKDASFIAHNLLDVCRYERHTFTLKETLVKYTS
jgi:hypothetical protein